MKKSNKTRIFAAFAASALAFSLLAGCGAPADKPTDADTPSASTPAPTEPDAPAADDDAPQENPLADLMGIIGMPDGEVTAQLGDGTASVGDGDVLIAREYALDVLGLEAAVSAIYTDDEKVSDVQALFSSASFDDAHKAMTEAYGAATAGEENAESGGQNAVWNLDGVTATLLEAYGSVSLMLSAA